LAKKKVVFTNGCFDLLHVGHLRYLQQARSLGDQLIVGLNSDQSVKRLKGESRPVQTELDRAEILKGLRCVDEVIIFNEDTPLKLIESIRPDILVKGGDWDVSRIVGADFVMSYGGEVKSLPFHQGRSTSNLIEKIIKST
jgi:D-glycero-beta-D-manno-heptose 1-phosphate adenylyltransferase